MVAANPISTSDGKSAMNGTLVMARYITDANMHFVQELTKSRIGIYNIDNLNSNNEKIRNIAMESNSEIHVEKLNEKYLTGYKRLMDIDNHPVILLGVEINRDVYANGKKAQQILVVCLLASILAVFVLFIMLIQKTVIKRIVNLNSFVKEVTISEDKNKSISMKGSDEISSLSSEINKMLGRINTAESEIKEKEKQLEMVLEGSSDGFWDWNMNDKTIIFSERALNMVEYNAEDLGNDQDIILKLTHPDDIDGVNEALNRTISGVSSYYGRENRLLTKSGIWKWFLIRGKIVDYNTDGTPKRMAGTITDISDRKKTEEEIRYLSYNDKLTGLFNRAYFEKEMNYIDTTSNLPYTFIIGDLNGLKLTNDVFGHDEGDRLLKDISHIIKKSCRETDVISRWGGDEFAILLIGTDEKNARIVCERINENCIHSESGYIKPSIALGLATKNRQSEDITKLMRDAEAAMYKNKMQEGKLVRTRILDSLRLELEAKSYENNLHYTLIRELSLKFGEQLKLSTEEMDKLLLLGEYHDLGEITISESILKKQNGLDSTDWEEIRKHPETGYRIAKAIPEISQIADNIVKHHERFDGSGYPYGIKGTEIPTLARMFSIIDAYASMTRENSYKITASSSEALEEIKHCAGSWFDPILVDEFTKLF
jgi:diguanylate cyclase (GGDEF)-like protein/PAS domain S-box-containing protein